MFVIKSQSLIAILNIRAWFGWQEKKRGNVIAAELVRKKGRLAGTKRKRRDKIPDKKTKAKAAHGCASIGHRRCSFVTYFLLRGCASGRASDS